MSTSACWGTNASFDCAWVYFGYGSRYDMINDYHKGWWVSLDALKVLVKYDYKFTPDHCPSPHIVNNLYTSNWYNKDSFIKRTMEDYIICEKYDIKGGGLSKRDDSSKFGWSYDFEKWDTFPPLLQMRTSAITIKHPNAGEWFLELKKHSGSFMRDNPDYRELIHYNQGRDSFIGDMPSLKAIKNINYSDWEIITRIEYMNAQAMEGEVEKPHLGLSLDDIVKFENAEELFKELEKD